MDGIRRDKRVGKTLESPGNLKDAQAIDANTLLYL